MPLRFPIDRVLRYSFARQHLGSGARDEDVLSVVRDIGPLRATVPETPYLSLWARNPSFARPDLDRALYEKRTLVRVPLMHARLLIVPTDRYATYYTATQARIQAGLADYMDRLLPPGAAFSGDLEHLVQRVLEVLSTGGPFTAEELSALLPALRTRILHDPEQPSLGYSEVGTRLLPALCARGLVVRARPRGSWRSRVDSYAALSAWLPLGGLEHPDPDQALDDIVRWYIKSYAPVTMGDLYQWLGNTPRHLLSTSLLRLGREVTHLQIDSLPADYLILSDQVEALLEHEPQGRDAALLPAHDGYLMAYGELNRLMVAPYRERVFNHVGEPLGTVWLDGSVIGTWWIQWKGDRIIVRFFQQVDAEGMALVAEEARRLAQFIDFARLDLDIGPIEDDDDGEDQEVLAYVQVARERFAIGHDTLAD